MELIASDYTQRAETLTLFKKMLKTHPFTKTYTVEWMFLLVVVRVFFFQRDTQC